MIQKPKALLLSHQFCVDQVIYHFYYLQNHQVFWVLQQLLHQRQNPHIYFLESYPLTHACESPNYLDLYFCVFEIVETTNALLDQVIALVHTKYLAQLHQTFQ